MEYLRQLLKWCSCFPIFRKKRSRYGYTIIRETKLSDSRRLSLLSTISHDKPIPNEILEEFEDHQDEIIQCMKDLKTSRILLEIPSLGRRLTDQLAEYTFQESGQYVDINLVADERDQILKQNLVYLGAHTNNVDRLATELMTRRVLSYSQYLVVSSFKNHLLKALEIFKLVLHQMDSLAFLIGALKVTGSDYVAEILVGNYFPEEGAELICRISLTPEFSPDFLLQGRPKKYRPLYTIPKDRQEILTSINCSYIEAKGKTILNSLEYAQNLTSIKLKNIKLKKEFQRKISLPFLKEFVLHIDQDFPTRKDLYDFITPKRVLSMLFFISDHNNNHQHNPESFDFDFTDCNTTDRWNINDIWRLNIDISIKIGGRTILLINHVKSLVFARLENTYKIPENICQPSQVRNLKVGWCIISRSFIPLYHVTRLHLYSIKFVSLGPNGKGRKCREDLNIIIKNLILLRELKIWGEVTAQPWPIIRLSSFPSKLKTLVASFVEIQVDVEIDEEVSHSDNSESTNSAVDLPSTSTATKVSSVPSLTSLENICLFIYEINSSYNGLEDSTDSTDSENKNLELVLKSKSTLKFLDILSNCKKVSLINVPPYQQPTQEQLLHIIQPGKVQQLLFSGCKHNINFDEHFLYFRRELIQNIEKAQSFTLVQEIIEPGRWVWSGRAQSKEEILHHLYYKFGFEELYSPEAFLIHEIISSMWKYFS